MAVEVAAGGGEEVVAPLLLVVTVPEAGTTAAFPFEVSASDETLAAVVVY